jgi:putative phosphoesterase
MRVAIVSDIHGNLTALEAVIADLSIIQPDLVVQAGDSALGGSQPAAVIDRIRELGWPGVMGNSDEVLWNPEAAPDDEKELVQRLVDATLPLLAEEHIQWLRTLPREWKGHGIGVVHATPGNLWRAVTPDADDATLAETFGRLGTTIAVYGHIHRPYVRYLPNLLVANPGSVGRPADGDPRASYLLLEDGMPQIRRVAFNSE